MGDDSSDGAAADGGPLTTEIIVRCSPAWKRALRVRASQRGMNMSTHIRQILSEEMGDVEDILGEEAVEALVEAEQ